MNDAGVAKRYAQALFMLADETGQTVQYGKDLDLVCDTIFGDEQFNAVFHGAQFSNASKKTVIEKVFKDAVAEDVLRFMLLLIEKMRSGYLADVRVAYQALLDEQQGIRDATVYSAFPLSVQEQDDIARALGKAVDKTIRLQAVEDPSLLAGIRLQYGDTIIDGSAKAKLAGMRERLASQSNHGGEQSL